MISYIPHVIGVAAAVCLFLALISALQSVRYQEGHPTEKKLYAKFKWFGIVGVLLLVLALFAANYLHP